MHLCIKCTPFKISIYIRLLKKLKNKFPILVYITHPAWKKHLLSKKVSINTTCYSFSLLFLIFAFLAKKNWAVDTSYYGIPLLLIILATILNIYHHVHDQNLLWSMKPFSHPHWTFGNLVPERILEFTTQGPPSLKQTLRSRSM